METDDLVWKRDQKRDKENNERAGEIFHQQQLKNAKGSACAEQTLQANKQKKFNCKIRGENKGAAMSYSNHFSAIITQF